MLCDDDNLFLSSVEVKIQNWARKNGHMNAIMIYPFTSSEDALEAWNRGLQIDALFLDIQIPNEISGLALAKEIRQSNESVPIVFVTSYGEFAEEGYIVNALRYLRKPISEDAIFGCLDIIWRRWTLIHADYILLDLPTQIIRLPPSSILYVEVSGHTCVLKTVDRESAYQFRQTMQYIRKKLSPPLFAQCHRSFIVNLMYIRHISYGCITMADGLTIQIGRKYQKEFMQQFRAFYLTGRSES